MSFSSEKPDAPTLTFSESDITDGEDTVLKCYSANSDVTTYSFKKNGVVLATDNKISATGDTFFNAVFFG